MKKPFDCRNLVHLVSDAPINPSGESRFYPEPTEDDWIAADLANNRDKTTRHIDAAIKRQLQFQGRDVA